jgi:hypothetical protein
MAGTLANLIEGIQMIFKTVLASAALALLVAQAQTAQAGVNIDVDVGGSSPRHSYYPDYGDDEDYEEYDQITCGEGRRIVRSAGYRSVVTIECEGATYRYQGFRRGVQWRITVDSEDGSIVRVRRARY